MARGPEEDPRPTPSPGTAGERTGDETERHEIVVRGRVFLDTGLHRASIGIDRSTGRISAIAGRLRGREVLDFGDRVVVPGAIDIHCHFRDPGHPQKEDFASGTLAALHGGVTTVLDMPNTEPAVTDADTWARKLEMVGAKAHVDHGVYGGVVRPGEATRELARRTPFLKTYLGESTGCVTLEDPESLPEILDDLTAAEFRGVWAIHCEDGPVLAAAANEHADAPGLRGHEARRPKEAETAAFQRLAEAIADHERRQGGPIGFRMHLAHVSTTGLARAAIGADWSWGVTPHHMLLHHDLPIGAFGRVNPPLRDRAEAETLHRFMRAGQVPIVESDHAPHTRVEKEQDVKDAPSGLPGVETMVPLLMAEVLGRRLELSHLVRATATAPARLIGAPKGRIDVGLDADLAVYDLGARSKAVPVTAEALHSKAGWTPFEGMPMLPPTHVFQRGRLVLDEGEVLARPGDGRPLH